MGRSGGLDVGDEAGLEALAQAVLERLQVVRGAVGGEHDLAPAVVEGVEGVEELLLGAGLALEELDVVDEQHVDVAEAALKHLGAAFAERAEELVREGLAGRRADGQRRVVADEEVGDRAEQVRLADAGRPADEERVVRLRGHLGDGQRGGVGEAVGVADHELVEGQLGVAERSAAGREGALGGRPAVAPGRERPPPARRVRRARAAAWASAGRSSTVASGPSTSSTLAWITRPKRPWIQRQVCGGRLERRGAPRASSTGSQGREPDAVRGLVDDECELGLDARPYVLELTAHGSVYPPLPGCVVDYSKRGPGARSGDYTQRRRRRRRGCSHLAEKFSVAADAPILGPPETRRRVWPRRRSRGATATRRYREQ